MSLCKQCITGFVHEGTPTGRIEKIAGVDVYIALPEGEYAKDKALLYLTDGLGLPLVNSKLLADCYAKNGLPVYMPDLFDGDSFPLDGLNIHNKVDPEAKYDVPGWVRKHNAKVTRPILDTVISALKEQGIKEFAAAGYCFGGKYSFNLAQESVVKVAVASHPSLIQVPADLETLREKSRAPMLINTCDIDQEFPIESCIIADKVLGDGKYTPGYKRVHWEGCMHGFAVRGDMNNPKIKAGKEGAFAEAVAWIKQYL